MELVNNYYKALNQLLNEFSKNLLVKCNVNITDYFYGVWDNWGRIKVADYEWYAVKVNGRNYFMQPNRKMDNRICDMPNRKTCYSYCLSEDKTMLLVMDKTNIRHTHHANFYIFDLSKQVAVTDYGFEKIIRNNKGTILNFK